MSRLIFLLVCYNLLSLNLGREYEPPNSAAFPFGDEVFNADLKEERFQEEYRSLAVQVVKDIYTFCPNVTEEEDRSDEEMPDNDSKCSKCDVRPTADKAGVLVECYNCTENANWISVSQEERHGNDHVLYLTTYLEIANYSAPEEVMQ